MTFLEWFRSMLEKYDNLDDKHIRYGQMLFNELYAVKPEIAKKNSWNNNRSFL